MKHVPDKIAFSAAPSGPLVGALPLFGQKPDRDISWSTTFHADGTITTTCTEGPDEWRYTVKLRGNVLVGTVNRLAMQ